jgi:WD40 repeat protein
MNPSSHYYADYDISSSGSMVYVPGYFQSPARSLLRVGRDGRVQPLSHTRRTYSRPRLSPDGRQLVAGIESDPTIKLGVDQWQLDIGKDVWTRVTLDGASFTPEWTPDGRWLAFGIRWGVLMRTASDGNAPAERLSKPLGHVNINAWSPDGRALVFSVQNRVSSWDIGMLPLEGQEPRWLLNSNYAECCAALSPDGRFMAYVSNESGRYDVYARRFPDGGERHLVSTEGGMQPRWSRDGRELFYRGLGEHPKLMTVTVKTGGSFGASVPRPLFDDLYIDRIPCIEAQYDVSAGSQDFIFMENPQETLMPTRLVLIPDWAGELRAKLRAASR